MAIQFPANPASQVPLNTFGPETTPLANATNEIVFTWDGEKWTGVLDTGGGGGGDASITVSETPPVSPSQGALWWDSSADGGRLWLWYEDGNTNQWVEASPNSGGTGGVEQLIAGSNITLSPADGKGVVTVNSTGGPGGVTYNGASAWGSVAADGTIKNGQNVASVVKTGTPGYEVTFTTPMANANYSVVGSSTTNDVTNQWFQFFEKTSTGFTAIMVTGNTTAVSSDFDFAVHSANAIAPPSGVGADAWGSFSGSAPGALINGMNVAQTQRTAGGTYQVTFTTPMPNATYAVTTAGNSSTPHTIQIRSKSTTGFTVLTTNPETGVLRDCAVSFTVHASSTVTPTYTWTRDGTTLKTANDGDMVVVGTYDESSDTAKGTRIGLFSGNSAVQTQVPLSASGSVGVYDVYHGSNRTINFAVGGSAEFVSTVTTGNVTGIHSIREGSNVIFKDGTVNAFGVGYSGATSSGNLYAFNSQNIRVGISSSNTVNPSTGPALVGVGSTSWSTFSDESMKTDLIPIENGLEKVSTLRTVTGRYLTDEKGTSRSMLIAQDVQAVLPEAVSTDASQDNKLVLRYTEVIPLLVSALHDAKDRIEALEAEVSLLKGGSN